MVEEETTWEKWRTNVATDEREESQRREADRRQKKRGGGKEMMTG